MAYKNNSLFVKLFLIIFYLLIFCFGLLDPDSAEMVFSVGVLVSSFFSLAMSRRSLHLFIPLLFIFYVNYSIVVGEYLVGGALSAPFNEVRGGGVYIDFLLSMFIFSCTLSLLLNNFDIEERVSLKCKENSFCFYGAVLTLIAILVFGIDRSSGSSYYVRITPLYEYSTIVLMFAYYYSGKKRFKVFVFLGLAVLFCFQDLVYGGRITTAQIAILLSLTLFKDHLSWVKVVACASLFFLVFSSVGYFRASSYADLHISGLQLFINDLFNGYFVFDTAVYSAYASATHIAASQLVDLNLKLQSIRAFIVGIFVGSPAHVGNITSFVRSNFFYNNGGGIFFTHFYFWFGYLGVFSSAIIFCTITNRKLPIFFSALGLRDYYALGSLIVLVTLPRWYLYTPLLFFRPLFLVFIIFITCLFFTRTISFISSSNTSRPVQKR